MLAIHVPLEDSIDLATGGLHLSARADLPDARRATATITKHGRLPIRMTI
jgi:hypothetical protein